MSQTEKEAALEALVSAQRAVPTDLWKSQLDIELRMFESVHKMKTAELKAKIDSGELPESAEFCTWLMVAKRYDRLIERSQNPPSTVANPQEVSRH